MRNKLIILMLLIVMLYGCQQANSFKVTPTDVFDTFKASPKPKLIERQISFNKKDVEGNLIDKYSGLCSFDNDNYYFSYKNDKYWIYSIANEKNKDIIPVLKIPISNDIFFEGVYNKNFVIGTGYWEKDFICHYELLIVSPDGEKRTIYKCISNGFPTANIVDNYVIVNLAESKENSEDSYNYISKLFYIDLETEENTVVETSEYNIVNDLYSGTFIINEGGWENGFCYQKVVMNKESMKDDNSGMTSIYYYSFQNKKSQLLTNYDKKVFYISGSNNCFVTSDYLLYSKETSGKIWLKHKQGYKFYDIPGIVAGEDIKKAYQLTDNIILIYNSDYYYLYDLHNKSFYKEKYEFGTDDPENYIPLCIVANNNHFAYQEPNENSIIVHLFKIN